MLFPGKTFLRIKKAILSIASCVALDGIYKEKASGLTTILNALVTKLINLIRNGCYHSRMSTGGVDSSKTSSLSLFVYSDMLFFCCF